jgi:NAD(P)-dependent dehydrogenase (short-subunit alcohol dehydrogenase family)
MASEWGRKGITANSVSPTVAWTELGQKAWGAEGVKEALFEKIPVGRAALPGEVADAVVFLCQVCVPPFSWFFLFLFFAF